MKYNVLNITTIYAMLIAFATLMITACPEPDKPTTKRETTKGTKTGPFTVAFALEGGTGNADTKFQTVPKGKPVTKPATAPTKDKFDFGEWYQDKARKVPFFFDTPITQNLTLYAGWNKPNEFTVRFHPNGGGGVAEQIIALNGKATRPTPPPPPQQKTDKALPLTTGTQTKNPQQNQHHLSLLPRQLPRTPSYMLAGSTPLRLTPMVALLTTSKNKP